MMYNTQRKKKTYGHILPFIVYVLWGTNRQNILPLFVQDKKADNLRAQLYFHLMLYWTETKLTDIFYHLMLFKTKYNNNSNNKTRKLTERSRRVMQLMSFFEMDMINAIDPSSPTGLYPICEQSYCSKYEGETNHTEQRKTSTTVRY